MDLVPSVEADAAARRNTLDQGRTKYTPPGIVETHTAYRPRGSEANRGCGRLGPIILPRPRRRAHLPRRSDRPDRWSPARRDLPSRVFCRWSLSRGCALARADQSRHPAHRWEHPWGCRRTGTPTAPRARAQRDGGSPPSGGFFALSQTSKPDQSFLGEISLQ